MSFSRNRSDTDYALGYTDAEQERLIRQATLIAPHTERLFREAGIGVGHRVLDLGSGMGDVSMLVAGLVGASGEVVGIERDATSIERAQARQVENGAEVNVETFVALSGEKLDVARSGRNGRD